MICERCNKEHWTYAVCSKCKREICAPCYDESEGPKAQTAKTCPDCKK